MCFNICNKVGIIYSGAEKKVETQVMCILFAATPERLTLGFFLRHMSYPESPGTCQGISYLWMTLNSQVPSLSFSQPVNVRWLTRREKSIQSHFPHLGAVLQNLFASRCKRIPGKWTHRSSILLQIQISLLNSMSWENKLLLALLLQFDTKACSCKPMQYKILKSLSIKLRVQSAVFPSCFMHWGK